MSEVPNQIPQEPQPPQPAVDEEPDLVAEAPKRRIRIAWIAGEETVEELGRTLQPLAIGLLDEMVELVLICPQRAPTADLPVPPIEVLRHGKLHHVFFKARTLDSLAQELSNRRVEVIHALDAGSAWLAGQLSRITDIPYVVSSYSMDDGRKLGTLDERAAAVLAASETIRANLLEHHVATAEKIQLVRPGVYQVRHTTLFQNPQQSTAIVAGGQMDDFDAFEAVLRTFADIKNREYDCVFFLIGNGTAELPLRRLAERLGLSESLTFVDWQVPTQLAGIFKAADIYISPVPLRRIDMQSLLAMAAGDPVLAAAGGCSDFLVDGKTALLFRQGDSSELTLKLMSLLENHAAARSLAENTLVYLRENYSPAITVYSMAELYRKVAEQVPVSSGTGFM